MKIDATGAVNQLISTAKSKTEVDTSSFEDALSKAVDSGDKAQLKKVCKDFESLFVNMMFTSMRKTVTSVSDEEKSQARETFDDMLFQELSSEMSKGSGIGMADQMYKSLLQQYGMDDKKSTSIDIKG